MIQHFLGELHLCKKLHFDDKFSKKNFYNFEFQHNLSDDKLFRIYSLCDLKIIKQPFDSVILAVAGNLVVNDPFFENVSGENTDKILLECDLLRCLKLANGTFSMSAYWGNGELTLATDSLGARPLYFTVCKQTLYFSTSFRAIVDICPDEQVLNDQALAEQIAYCYPLANRTLSSTVFVLRDGQYLSVKDGRYSLARYWDWRNIKLLPRNREIELENCKKAFQEAVRERVVKGRSQYALLSGGLDSRMIVAQLHEDGHHVTGGNCSIDNTLDEHLCMDFARLTGADVRRVQWTRDALCESAGMTTAAMLKCALSSLSGLPDARVFSGDGGGELFGFLLLSKEILAELYANGLEKTITYAGSRTSISRKIFKSSYVDNLEELALQGIVDEFKHFSSFESQKAFQMFLILNDLRCHLHEYFNSMDSGAMELDLPYLDKRVIASVLQISPPFDEYIGHRFYYDLMPRVSPLMKMVPWQAYPKSEQCPIKIKHEAMDQWSAMKEMTTLKADNWRRETLSSLFFGNAPSFIRVFNLATVALICEIFPKYYTESFSYLFKQFVMFKNAFGTLKKTL